jgi:hypothetical protein
MKNQIYPRVKFLLLLCACASLAASATTQAGAGSWRSEGTTHLIVWRAADFGTVIYLNLSIDGVRVTSLDRGQGYEAILRPGRHVLSVSTSPSPYGATKLTHFPVVLNSGQTNQFTAIWENADDVRLTPGEPPHISQSTW